MIDEIRIKIGCRDIIKQIEFYTKIIGARIISTHKDYAVLEIAGVQFLLWDASTQEKAQKVSISMVTSATETVKGRLRENRSIANQWENCDMLTPMITMGTASHFSLSDDSRSHLS